MSGLTSTERLEAWRTAQGAAFPDQMNSRVELGPIYSDSWLRDPKHLGFALARYKFVAKMFAGCELVAEVGAGDGWASAIVGREVGLLDLYDLAPLREGIAQHDAMVGRLPRAYGAIYAIDVLEHVKDGWPCFCNLADSLLEHGKLIVGLPSLEGQLYASQPSRLLHKGCMSGEELRRLALRFFRHVFMFGMNDELVHTGFMPMAHYLFAVCAEPIR
jgi:hypothetical protein